MSFCLLGGLGLTAECELWRRGVFCWNDYRRQGKGCFCQTRHDRILADMEIAEAALVRQDIRFFLREFPTAARVRVFPLLVGRAVYLDIETTGLGPADSITTTALYDGRQVRTFVCGKNLPDVKTAIPNDCVLVTYNGRRFDVPRLRRELACRLRQPHLDLCPVLHAAGFGPGFKACERQLNVGRPILAETTGLEAVQLWRQYQHGDAHSLTKLLAYNVEDVLGLERVLIAGCNHSMRNCSVFRPLPFPRQPRRSDWETLCL
jgi:uncharacterized protein YprB with RNaseH-like and TPR domain